MQKNQAENYVETPIAYKYNIYFCKQYAIFT